MYRFDAQVWRWKADGAWHFVTLPQDLSDEIDEAALRVGSGGFGSVRVRVRVGATGWTTSVFPDRGRGAFVLPLKKAVRAAEGIAEGDTVCVALEVLPPAT